jgi:hypothetical protein
LDLLGAEDLPDLVAQSQAEPMIFLHFLHEHRSKPRLHHQVPRSIPPAMEEQIRLFAQKQDYGVFVDMPAVLMPIPSVRLAIPPSVRNNTT